MQPLDYSLLSHRVGHLFEVGNGLLRKDDPVGAHMRSQVAAFRAYRCCPYIAIAAYRLGRLPGVAGC